MRINTKSESQLRVMVLAIAGFAVLGAGQIEFEMSGTTSKIRVSAMSAETARQSAPKIMSARMKGRKLIVTGDNFDNGAEILVNGVGRPTSDSVGASTLISKKAGKKLEVGQVVKLQVQNSDGQLSGELSFYTGCGES